VTVNVIRVSGHANLQRSSAVGVTTHLIRLIPPRGGQAAALLLAAALSSTLPPPAAGQSSLSSEIQLQKGIGTQEQQGTGTQLKKLQKGIKKAPPTPAEVKSVRVTPSSADAEAGKALVLPLRWSVRLTPDAPDVEPVDLVSNRGELAGDRIAGKLAEADAVGNVSLKERIRVDGKIIAGALAAGRRELTYRRTFRAGDGKASASVRIRLNGSLLTGVDGRAVPSAVRASRRSRVTINWALDVNRVGSGSPMDIRSKGGVLTLPDGSRVGKRSGRPLKRSGVRDRTNISEQLSLSAAQTSRALDRGYGRLLYAREFTDGLSTHKATVAIDLLSPGGSGRGKLALTRVDLSFADGSKKTTIGAGKSLRARALVTSRGSGRLKGAWEISQPPSTPDNPQFKKLKLINTTVDATGERHLVSPTLPTKQTGAYLVRLVLQETAFEDIPLIRYAVRGGKDQAGLRLVQPADGGTAHAETTFSWQGLARDHSHRLELFTRRADDSGCPSDDVDPVAGASVKAGVARTRLSPLTRRRLEPGSSYCWRVRALEGKQQVAVSDVRSLRWVDPQVYEEEQEAEQSVELAGIVAQPGDVNAGERTTGRVRLTAPAPENIRVALTSEDDDVLAFPDYVEVYRGRSDATFNITADSGAWGTYQVTASVGDSAKTAELHVESPGRRIHTSPLGFGGLSFELNVDAPLMVIQGTGEPPRPMIHVATETLVFTGLSFEQYVTAPTIRVEGTGEEARSAIRIHAGELGFSGLSFEVDVQAPAIRIEGR